MFLDVVFLILLAFACFKGIRDGLIVAVFSLVAWIVGLFAAVKFSHVAEDYLKANINVDSRWLSVLAFLLVFALVVLVVNILARIIEKTIELAFLGWVNKIGGIFFYVLLYALIFTVFIYFAEKVKLVNEETISSSRVYNALQPVIITLKQLL